MKKKIGDLTLREAKEMQDKICNVIVDCADCPFYAYCIKDYIDLDQEIEIKGMNSTNKNFDWDLLFSILKEWANNSKALEILKEEFSIELFENANGNKAISIYSDTDKYAVVKEVSQEKFNALNEVFKK